MNATWKRVRPRPSTRLGDSGEIPSMPKAPAPYDVVRIVRSRQRMSAPAARSPIRSETGASMKIHHLFVDQKGESHFEDMEIPYVESGRTGRLSARLPATGIIFREVQPDYDLDWHPAPRRQYIINPVSYTHLTLPTSDLV